MPFPPQTIHNQTLTAIQKTGASKFARAGFFSTKTPSDERHPPFRLMVVALPATAALRNLWTICLHGSVSGRYRRSHLQH